MHFRIRRQPDILFIHSFYSSIIKQATNKFFNNNKHVPSSIQREKNSPPDFPPAEISSNLTDLYVKKSQTMALHEVFIGNVALSCQDAGKVLSPLQIRPKTSLPPPPKKNPTKIPQNFPCFSIFHSILPLPMIPDIRQLFEDTAGLTMPASIRINKRFAFASFRDRYDAEATVKKLHGVHFLGDTLRVELGKSPGKGPHTSRGNGNGHRGGGGGGGRGGGGNRASPRRASSPARSSQTGRAGRYSKRPRSTELDFFPRYPYGAPPLGQDSLLGGGSRHSPSRGGDASYYSGYPIVHHYESVRPSGGGSVEPGDSLLGGRYHPGDLYDPYRRQSPDYRQQRGGSKGPPPSQQQSSLLGLEGPSSPLGLYGHFDDGGAGDSYYTSALAAVSKYENGRYGSRNPLESSGGGRRGYYDRGAGQERPSIT